jgi:putative toxin-antitoxin system antitoxin component (TIGR02293 family)
MHSFIGIADVLGLPSSEITARSPFGLISSIENGLPFGALDRVAHLLAPSDPPFKYRLIPKTSYEKRKNSLRLSSDEGTRLARVARVWTFALDVWQSEGEARDFVFRHDLARHVAYSCDGTSALISLVSAGLALAFASNGTRISQPQFRASEGEGRGLQDRHGGRLEQRGSDRCA